MKKILLILIIAILEVSTYKFFLMGGGISDNQTQIYQSMASATKKKPSPNNCSDDWKVTTCPRIAVITSGYPNSTVGNNAYNLRRGQSLSYKQLFLMHGFSPKHITVHIDNYQKSTNLSSPQGQANSQILKLADVIYFTDGNQSRHLRSWFNDEGGRFGLTQVLLWQILGPTQTLIGGLATGAMLFSYFTYGEGTTYGHLYFANAVGLAPKNISDGGNNGTGLFDTRNGTSGLQYLENGGTMPGMRIDPVFFDSHFDSYGRIGRMVPALSKIRMDLGAGIDDGTALFFQNGKGTVLGKRGVFVVDKTKAIRIGRQFFAIQGILVTYLTSGDTYDFRAKKLTPQQSKKQIVKPSQEGSITSTNIFRNYEVTKLITRLIDQTGLQNVGKCQIQGQFGEGAPVFKLTFSKNTQTKGYWSSSKQKYTAHNVNLLITYE